jgi:hypothetical protein
MAATLTQTASPPAQFNPCNAAEVIQRCNNGTVSFLSPTERKCCPPSPTATRSIHIELVVGSAFLVAVCAILIPVVFSYVCWRRNNFLASKKRTFAVNWLIVFLSVLMLCRSVIMLLVRRKFQRGPRHVHSELFWCKPLGRSSLKRKASMPTSVAAPPHGAA